MSKSNLDSILKQGDVAACLAFFEKLTEKERQNYAKQVEAALKEAQAQGWKETTRDGSTTMQFQASPNLPALKAAVWAACSFGTIKRLGWQAIPEKDDDAYRILVTRKPEFLNEWAEWICELRNEWPLVRRLIREGLCRKPDSDNYTLLLITNLCAFHESKRTIYDALVDDPDLLRDDIWRVFEVEGDSSSSLAGRDKYTKRPENTWAHALLQLAKENKLPRGRLLDASLDALARDFGTFQAGWFSRFHEALEPTLPERAELAQAYLALLGSRVAPTVSFALKAILQLTNNNLVEPAAVLASVTPALTNRHKGTVLSALQLLDQVSKQNPKLHPQIGIVLAEALLHTSPDVHKKAIDMLARGQEPISNDLAQVLRERLDHVAASQRTRLLTLLSSDSSVQQAKDETTPPDADENELRQRAAALVPKWRKLAGVDRLLASLDSGQSDLAGLDFDPMDIPRLDPEKRLAPIETIDELIDDCAHVLENPDHATDLERVFDGISRLCAERPSDFDARTGPLRKRTRDRMAQTYAAPFWGFGPLVDLGGLVLAWLSGELVMATKTGVYEYDKNFDLYQLEGGKEPIKLRVSRHPTVARFQSQRVLEIAQRCIAGHAAPLLAAPTHQGGWIEPSVLVERAIARQGLAATVDRLDQIQALLRLPPDGRALARKAAGKVRGEFGQALRYALGGDESIGADVPLWIAASRARHPFDTDEQLQKTHPGLGPNAAEAARYQPQVQPIPNDSLHRKQLCMEVMPAWPKSVGVDVITVMLTPKTRAAGSWHLESRQSAEELHGMLLIWPIQREAWFGAWAQTFANNLDWWEAAWGHRVFLEPLLDPDVPLGPMARLLLALGLAAKEPGESSLATDALIAAIDDARFDADRFGETLAYLWPMLKAARLAKTLGQAARVSRLHQHLICRALQASLRGDPTAAPRDLSAVLELLKESLIEGGEGITNSDARLYLKTIKASGKTARLVRDILGLANHPQPAQTRTILLHALRNRIERAESWNIKCT